MVASASLEPSRRRKICPRGKPLRGSAEISKHMKLHLFAIPANSEYGFVVPQDIAYIALRVHESGRRRDNELPGAVRRLIDRQVDEIEAQIRLGIVTTRSPTRTGAGKRPDHSERAGCLAMQRTSTTRGNLPRCWGLCHGEGRPIRGVLE